MFFEDYHIKKLSLRDPDGSLFELNDRLIRIVRKDVSNHLKNFLESPTFHRFSGQNKLPRTRVIPEIEAQNFLAHVGDKNHFSPEEVDLVIEHDKIFFASYPYEWCPEMLYEAGILTLEIALRLLPEGLGLKDATPYNVLFSGTHPIFVDILSIEKRTATDPTWRPYSQFTQNFLTPLLVAKYFNVSLDRVFLSHKEGLSPEETYQVLRWHQKIRPPFLGLVTLPYLLSKLKKPSRDAAEYQPRTLENPEKARFILNSILEHLKRQMRKLQPAAARNSSWGQYLEKSLPYSKEQFEFKKKFLSEVAVALKAKNVLDIGCNEGHFSAVFAEKGASVVAIDLDSGVVSKTWEMARARKLDILPLLINLNRPSPSVGWFNSEANSFIERARKRFDLVLGLALLHHLVETDRIPFLETLKLFRTFTTQYLILEYVGPQDQSRIQMRRGRNSVELQSVEEFERLSSEYFDIVQKQVIPNSERILYLLKIK